MKRSLSPRLLRVLTSLAVLLLSPTLLMAQRATGSMIVRVDGPDGSPAAGVDIALVAATGPTSLATTSESGLATILLSAVDLPRGTRVSVEVERCGERWSLLLLAPAARPRTASDCTVSAAGAFEWGETERLAVRLGETGARAISSLRQEAREARQGTRLNAAFLLSFLGGSDFDYAGTGFGGRLMGGYDWASGAGIRLGASGTVHGIDRSSSDLWRWSALFEPRWTFHPPASTLEPYVAARVSHVWHVYSKDASGQPASFANEDGWGLGGGGGLGVRVFGRARLDLSAYVGWLSVSSSVNDPVTGTIESTTSGTEIQVALGLGF